MRQDGFTLLEVLVLIAILASVAVVAAPQVRVALARIDAESAAERIAAALSEGRELAVTRNRAVRVAIDGRAVSVEGGRWRRLPEGVSLSAPAGGGVVFHPDGSSQGAQVVVSAVSGRAWLVSVEPLTGRVRRLHAGQG